MASSEGDRSFASIAASNKNEKLVLNSRLVQVTREEIERCKDLVKGKKSTMKIGGPGKKNCPV